MENKTCKICQQSYSLDRFPTGSSKNGVMCYRGTCKDCKNKKTKEVYKSKETPRIWNRHYKPPKNKKCVCSCCESIYYQTARYVLAIKNKNLKNYCSLSCRSKAWSGENNKFFKTDNWQLKQYIELNQVRRFDETELKYSISKAKYLIRSKIYFRYQNLCPETAVSNAYIMLTERGHDYTRKLFYLLIWSSLSRDRYYNIKSNPVLYRQYLDRQNEYQAIARVMCKKHYLRQLFRKAKNPINPAILDDNPEIYSQKIEKLKSERETYNRVLKGETLQFYSHILPYKTVRVDAYNMKHNEDY